MQHIPVFAFSWLLAFVTNNSARKLLNISEFVIRHVCYFEARNQFYTHTHMHEHTLTLVCKTCIDTNLSKFIKCNFCRINRIKKYSNIPDNISDALWKLKSVLFTPAMFDSSYELEVHTQVFSHFLPCKNTLTNEFRICWFF